MNQRMTPSQLALPLESGQALAREDFVVAAPNAQAFAFIASWPDWPVAAAAIHGPAGSGKSHLVAIWAKMSGANIASVSTLEAEPQGAGRVLAVEDVDSVRASDHRDRKLFDLLESATPAAPLLFTGRETPSSWACVMPDLASRFAAMPGFALEPPDDALLAAIARKLFADRQLAVPDAVIERMLLSLERSPAAIREFVALADLKALAEVRTINLALVRELLAEREGRLS